MLQRLKELFIGDAISPADNTQRLQLAAAALLIELSKADFQRDPREQAAIAAAIRSSYNVDEATLTELLSEAETASDRATSLYEFTSVINTQCSEEQKYDLVCELWRVAYADGAIDKYEDHLIGKIAELIYLPRSQFIRAKLAVVS